MYSCLHLFSFQKYDVYIFYLLMSKHVHSELLPIYSFAQLNGYNANIVKSHIMHLIVAAICKHNALPVICT